LLGRIDEEDLRSLARAAVRRSFQPDEILFLRGDAGHGVYAIVSGSVRVFVEGANGGDVVVATRGAGDVLGELSLLDGMARSASARAIGPVTTLFLPRDAFDAWLGGHPAAARALLAVLSLHLREATDQVAEMALLSVEARVARRLWQICGGNDGTVPSDGVSVRVNQAELAAAIGVTRESVNKHLARMKQAGVIATRTGRITLLDAEGLRRLCEEAF